MVAASAEMEVEQPPAAIAQAASTLSSSDAPLSACMRALWKLRDIGAGAEDRAVVRTVRLRARSV